jgi:hypothetical protein
MKTPLTVAAVVAIFGLVTQAQAAPSSVLPGNAGWEDFADNTAIASFAWAGENESLAHSYDLLGKPRQGALVDDGPVDTRLLTGLPAPEPPALVLAGMAFGGVLCGRSLLTRRRKAEKPIAEIEA